ncbi:hypothetical protein ANN_00971 [Periplaneta americana]|uniref:Uncharacterized protein n=1 Tax=Periplaneta americana TaxID=6978 RepID=A0ABQ8TVI4_PERAM|nr:hypothetical protein ANN_00971 [Periplaneta americana]
MPAFTPVDYESVILSAIGTSFHDVTLTFDQLREVTEEELLPIFGNAEDSFIRGRRRVRNYYPNSAFLPGQMNCVTDSTSTNNGPVKRKLQGRRKTTVPVSDYEIYEIELDTDYDLSGVLSIFTDNTLRDRHSTAIETRRAFQKIRQVNGSERTVRRRLDECGLIPEDQLKAQNCSSNIVLNNYVLLTMILMGTWESDDECSSQMNRDLFYRWT